MGTHVIPLKAWHTPVVQKCTLYFHSITSTSIFLLLLTHTSNPHAPLLSKPHSMLATRFMPVHFHSCGCQSQRSLATSMKTNLSIWWRSNPLWCCSRSCSSWCWLSWPVQQDGISWVILTLPVLHPSSFPGQTCRLQVFSWASYIPDFTLFTSQFSFLYAFIFYSFFFQNWDSVSFSHIATKGSSSPYHSCALLWS